MNEFLTQNL